MKQKKQQPQSLAIKRVKIETLKPDARNARKHGKENLDAIRRSLTAFGQVEPLVVQKSTGKVIGGNGRVEAMKALGITDVDVVEIEIADDRAAALGIALNRTGELAEWDEDTLAELLGEMDDGARLDAGWDDDEFKDLLDSLAPTETVEDEAPAPLPDPVSRTGDLWVMGGHRLLCGDCTKEADAKRVTEGSKVSCIVTDPPYCSGGFQEAGKVAGSVGRDTEFVPIANDKLSTRGYSALLKAAFGNVQAGFLYAFTDWRMWIHLFDIAESCGFCVRSMIVWDKGSPGMGRGWRCQHELILWGCKATAPFDKHASGCGNVIQSQRTGNALHTTEKPVELLAALLTNTPFADTLYEPFSGSGTTIIAAEQLNRRCFAIEIEPRYVDVAVRRWQKLTGKAATLDGDGRTWDQIADKR